ncbi:MAG TPA: CHAD domain-containing protein [Polyangia bacterium]|jgi:CHAD domain-containing protein
MSKPAPIEGLDANTTLEDAARASISARLGDVRRFEEKLTGAADPDDVHDMRVASRRLRAALALFDRKHQLCDAYNAATALGDALGEVRELHVQLAWLREELAAASERDKVGLQALLDEREQKLPKRLEKLKAALGTWTEDGVPSVEAALAGLSVRGKLGGHRVRRRMAQRLKDSKRRVSAVVKSIDARTAHKLRIGAKKLRYLAELAQPAFPAEIGALLDRLQPLQETLGELHDADVHIPIVEKFLVRADALAQPGALVLLRSEMSHREAQAAALNEALGKLREDRVLESVRDALC